VVGGGLAGLTTAYELQKRGIVAQIIEASDVRLLRIFNTFS